MVDDAIVMIENIVRFIENGDAPLDAALKGSQQIGFTIVSLTISLIAVLIPLLFMQDIVGRLFREFAVTLSVTILVSALVSLTLTPMMCSKLLKDKAHANRGRFYEISERAFWSDNRVLRLILRCSGSSSIRRQHLFFAAGNAGSRYGLAIRYRAPRVFSRYRTPESFRAFPRPRKSSPSTPCPSSSARLTASSCRIQRGGQSVFLFIGIDGTNTTLLPTAAACSSISSRWKCARGINASEA